MRPLLVIVADKDIREAFKGLFARPDWPRSLGCRRFDVGEGDLVEPAGRKDSGLFKEGEALARGFAATHEHLFVVLDAAWKGSPGAHAIEEDLGRRLVRNGWSSDRFEVVAIDPELEVWLWSDRRALGTAIECEVAPERRAELQQKLDSLAQETNPGPKERLEDLRRSVGIRASSAQFHRFAGAARVDRCRDPAFHRLRDALRRWFPP